jgi:hypothetical protein
MEITGFDEQIGVIKKIAKAGTKINKFVNKKTAFIPQPKVAIKRVTPTKSVVVKKATPTKSVAPQKSVVVKKSTLAKAMQAKRVSPMQKVVPSKTVAIRKSNLVKMIQAKKANTMVKPTQPSPIVTAKSFKSFTSTSPSKASTMQRPSAPVKVFSTDGKLTNVSPASFKKMDDVARSFARVDLPYQAVTPKTKVMRVKNSPINLPININMIEPAVDAGVSDYYGK